MSLTFRYGTHTYSYYVEFSQRKSMTLIVYPNLNVAVRAPLDATLDDIETFLTRKWLWLDKRLNEFRKYQKYRGEKEYVPGESFNYL